MSPRFEKAISSIYFDAPRCADLPELLQVQMLFTSIYGKEFVSAATELRPDCGVNHQLLKEIAEHEDWDPTSTEIEFFKPCEDLLPDSDADSDSLDLPEFLMFHCGRAQMLHHPVINPPSPAAPKPEKNEMSNDPDGAKENKQFLPFISPPSISATPSEPPPAISKPKTESNLDLQDVLAADQEAAETAERAADAARSAASRTT
ncbi:hypothetical protein F3Y22_tig00110007pilonHSYRG00112 [Hibiscus syriacus]|uniref:Uncharacterized protein n=1 Tax=Hibiscus syriacus TaxID=106335 RepID=A0A6A3BUT6_HIBSY|nr:hypothetical protein F3Y22_tig00110007pilonHSYRG00112 [Hibiscus syriacus]